MQLAALFKMFRKLRILSQQQKGEYQVFAYVTQNSPMADAIYVHSPNPNGTPFPYEPQVSQWLETLPFWLAPSLYIAGQLSRGIEY